MGTKISELKGGFFMEKWCDFTALKKFCDACRENDLEEVKKLVEAGEVEVDKLACIDTVRHGSHDVLQYFLQKNNQFNDVWIPVMQDAICHGKFLALKVMIVYFREHKMEFDVQKVEDAILKILVSIASTSTNPKSSMSTIRAIIDWYLK